MKFWMYSLDLLLQRLFSFLHQQNPELAEDKRRSVLRPPIVLPEGTTKTVFVNFIDLFQTMHRQPEQLISFMSTELGTSGSLDGENRLVVKDLIPKFLKIYCKDI